MASIGALQGRIMVSPQLKFQDVQAGILLGQELKDEDVAKVVLSLSAREILVGPREGPTKDIVDGIPELNSDPKNLYKV